MRAQFLCLSLLLTVFGCDEPGPVTTTARDVCDAAPPAGAPGGACFVDHTCDEGAYCNGQQIGSVCEARCSSSSDCECGKTCGVEGLCEMQCKSSDNCADGMVCDALGEGASVCVWPALAPLPDICPMPIACPSTAAAFCTAVDIAAEAHGVDQSGRDDVAQKCWGHELAMCELCLFTESACSASVGGVECDELASLCMCYGETLPWFLP